MARKKTAMTEPEYSDTNMEETSPLPEGEVPAEGVQEDAPGGEIPDGESMPDGGETPDSEPLSSDGGAVFPDAEPHFTDTGSDAVAEGFPSEGPPPDGISQEESAADPQYEDLLHEMESTTPFPPAEDGDAAPQDDPPPLMEPSADDTLPEELPSSETQPVETSNAGEAPAERTAHPRARRAPPTQRSDYVLTIDTRDRVQTEEEREEIIWHEIRNAYRTRRILTGILGGVEQTKSGRTLAIVDYKGFRVAIPILEMLLYTGEMPSNREYLELMGRLNRMLSTMLGAEIDFMVKGIDSNTRSIVASRKDAMLRTGSPMCGAALSTSGSITASMLLPTPAMIFAHPARRMMSASRLPGWTKRRESQSASSPGSSNKICKGDAYEAYQASGAVADDQRPGRRGPGQSGCGKSQRPAAHRQDLRASPRHRPGDPEGAVL